MTRAVLWCRVSWGALRSRPAATAWTVVLLAAVDALFAVAASATRSFDNAVLLLLAVVAASLTVAGLDVGRSHRDAVDRVLDANGATTRDRMGQAAVAALVLTAVPFVIGCLVRTLVGLWAEGQHLWLPQGVVPDPGFVVALALASVAVPTAVVARRARRAPHRALRNAPRPARDGGPTLLGWCVGAVLAFALASVGALANGPYLMVVLAGGVLLLGGVMTLGAWAPEVLRPVLARLGGIGGLYLGGRGGALWGWRIRATSSALAVLAACAAAAIVVVGVLDQRVDAIEAAPRDVPGAPPGIAVVRVEAGGPEPTAAEAAELVAPYRAVLGDAAVAPISQLLAPAQPSSGWVPVFGDPAVPRRLAFPALLTAEVAEALDLPADLASGDRPVVLDRALLVPGSEQIEYLPAGGPLDAVLVERGLTLGVPGVWFPTALADRLDLQTSTRSYLLDAGAPLTDGQLAGIDALTRPAPASTGGLTGGPPGARWAWNQGAVVAIFTADRTASTMAFPHYEQGANRADLDVAASAVGPILALGVLVLLATVLVSAAERRRDDELLVVQGATAAIHRRLAVIEAAYVGLAATLAGVVLGGGWALLAQLWFNVFGRTRHSEPMSALSWVVPWELVLVVIAVPTLSALVAAVVTRPIRRLELPSLAEPW